MNLSILLARLIGLALVIFCASILLNRKRVQSMIDEVIAHPIFLYLAGSLDVIFGLIIVLIHNVWVWGWPILITLAGWLILIRGILRLFFPANMIGYMKKFSKKQREQFVNISSIVFLIVGLIFLYLGYIHRF